MTQPDSIFNADSDNPIRLADSHLLETFDDLDARDPDTVDHLRLACRQLFRAAVAASSVQARAALRDIHMEIC